MSKYLKILFPVHMVVAAILGVLFLVIPGRFLGWFGWAPVDPLLTRVLGAALLGLAWGSFRGWRSDNPAQARVLIELDAVFCTVGALGLLRHLVIANYPYYVWLLFGGLALFAIAWIVALVKKS